MGLLKKPKVAVTALVLGLYILLVYQQLWSHRSRNVKHAATNAFFLGSAADPVNYQRENASLVVLCRNSDLGSITKAIMSVEHTWNGRYGYPYVFLNNEEFSEEFINVTSSLVYNAHYEVIPEYQWSTPSWIDEERAREGRQRLEEMHIIYAGSVEYRHMCRFFAGFYYRTPVTSQYRYLMRLDNDVTHLCKLDYDPFKLMRESDIKYGFTIAVYEFGETIETLWDDTLKFLYTFPDASHPHNLGRFVSEDNGQTYNRCHFWSNFEVVDADFLRGPTYSQYFDYLDKMGGFYYERWGDAPVHALAASLFLDRDQIHFFEDLGYSHPPYQHLPEKFMDRGLKCYADPGDNVDWDAYSCLRHYYAAQDMELPPGIDKVKY